MQLLEGAECEYNLLKYNELRPYEAPAARAGAPNHGESATQASG